MLAWSLDSLLPSLPMATVSILHILRKQTYSHVISVEQAETETEIPPPPKKKKQGKEGILYIEGRLGKTQQLVHESDVMETL